MRRLLLIVVLSLVGLGLVGFVYLGWRPPHPATHTVQRTVPNDQLPTH